MIIGENVLILNPSDLDDVTVLSWKNLDRGPGHVNMMSSGKMAAAWVT